MPHIFEKTKWKKASIPKAKRRAMVNELKAILSQKHIENSEFHYLIEGNVMVWGWKRPDGIEIYETKVKAKWEQFS